ncbi:Hypothetical protein, putative [Bodo saltans]|uniref:Uncharacterized protein n=1 Tax=Bodo saltans TaxID=75058 RepID=A0A0S4JDL6_BODSA|nr:Hypothetical protein, putative [Bodo saltans]|eukprot:CUG88062.1 Hypothetical protein, putative [Bodo saltans]
MFAKTCIRKGIGKRLRASAREAQQHQQQQLHRTPRHQQSGATGLVDPYSAEWHGFHRGPIVVPVLPEEISISILSEAVPFHQDALLITHPSTSRDVRLELTRAEDSLQKHMQAHFKKVMVQSLKPRPASDPRSASLHHATGKSLMVASPPPSLPQLKSPTESLPFQSLDVVCLAPTVFSEILQQNPYFLTSFHQVLRPHGIIAITGMQRIRIQSPSWIASEYKDLVEHLRQECEASYVRNSEEDTNSGDEWVADSPPHHSPPRPQSLGVARSWKEFEFRRRSVEAEHRDIYLPFPNIKRRTFTSMYHLTLEELMGSLRALPEIDVALGKSNSSGRRLPTDPVGVMRENSSASSFSTAANPLQVFEGLLSARLGDAAASSEACVVAEVDSFVITCNWRRANHIPGSDSSRQLETAGFGGRLSS